MKPPFNHGPDLGRRRFLGSAAALAAASALPRWALEEVQARESKGSRKLGPNDQPGIALVGCGGMGRNDARLASKFGRVIAVCDVDDERLAQAQKDFPGAATYKDFRKVVALPEVDVVICGTVDHWHTLVSIAAMRAGKDVYCEKPLTLTIDEGKQLVKVAKETGRILQTGSQQRSDKNFRLACELVRNGRIGALEQVHTVLPSGLRGGPFAVGTPPAGLDWDFWQGPTPETPYVKERSHFSFRYWWDYSGGTMTDWGAHHNDIALWGMGLERSGPATVSGMALIPPVPGGFTAASAYLVEYRYGNGVVHFCKSTDANNPSGGVVNRDGPQHGVTFIGKEGWIFVTRGRITASHPELLLQPLPAKAKRLYASDNHMQNFFDCIRSRRAPICDVEIGHRSASLCHLGVISMRLGRRLEWDPVKELFVGDKEANTFVVREMRKPWDLQSLG